MPSFALALAFFSCFTFFLFLFSYLIFCVFFSIFFFFLIFLFFFFAFFFQFSFSSFFAFFCFSTLHQFAFIKKDLSGVDRTKTPWLVFAGHRPMYVNSGGAGAGDCEGAAAAEEHCANDQPVAKLLRSSLEPLLIKHQVSCFYCCCLFLFFCLFSNGCCW